MSAVDKLFDKMTVDIARDLAQYFDRSFERKAFDGKAWKVRRHRNAKGSLLLQTGQLRRSISHRVSGRTITFVSHLPYARIHNDGGEIKVTAKMKKFFWAMYRKNSVRIKKRKTDGQVTSATRKFSEDAEFWKSLALKKVGSTIKIPQRQFIGWGKEPRQRVERMVGLYMDHLIKIMAQIKNPR